MLRELVQKLAEAQQRGEIRFHLIGGYGLDAHGYSRHTQDLDILIASDHADAIHAALENIGFIRHDKTPSFLRYWHPTENSFPPIDVMVVNPPTFARLSSDSVDYLFQGIKVTCPSVASFIALKLHALKNNPFRTQKDLSDIASLMEKNPENVTMEQLKALCDRYASPQVFEKLRILLQP